MSRQIAVQNIPESLIYEMVDGNPIYYKGYQEVLEGNKHLEQIMSDSNIQAFLKMYIGNFLINFLGEKYIVTGGEHGLWFRKKSWRAADLAVFAIENFEWTTQYSKKPPEVVIEIDTKANLDNIGSFIEYFDEKNKQLLAFGVKKVIWIFTDNEKVHVVQNDKVKEVFDWSDDIAIVEICFINIHKIINDAPFEKK
ncbi:MAG: Uma2 family endonuclease [Bacteroidota bacterium]